jgi:FtsP/CotA-like multicopper oxidase with cupredoxin domain
MLTRREMLKRGIWAPAVLSATNAAVQAQDLPPTFPPSPSVVPFTRRLKVPRPYVPLNRPGATPLQLATAQSIFEQAIAEQRFAHAEVPPDYAQADYYEVVMRPALQPVLPGLPPTYVWGFDGSWPGPTFLFRRERTAVIRWTIDKAIDEVCSTHYHGGHTPADSDGVPMTSYTCNDVLSPLSPVGSRTFVFPNDNPFPATLWYHDHGQDVTAFNVYMGLAGFALLQPNAADLANPDATENRLPSGYGRYDIPMVFQDRLFDANAQLIYDPFLHDGLLGDRFCVNGEVQPYLPVARRKYRFRWLNGSNARQYELFLSTGDQFFVVGSDGGLLPRCVQTSSLRITPAERYEVVIDFSKYPVGTKLYLQNCLEQFSGRGPEDEINFSSCTPLVEFRVERDEGPDQSMSLANGTILAPEIQNYIDTYLTPQGGEPIRSLNFGRSNGGWTVNDRFFDRNRVDIVERLNTRSIWRLINTSGGWQHPIHIHDEEFSLRSRNGALPRPYERGLKDTFIVGEEESLDVAAYWTGEKNLGQYVFHCHNLEHEDMAMMGIFEVVP